MDVERVIEDMILDKLARIIADAKRGKITRAQAREQLYEVAAVLEQSLEQSPAVRRKRRV